MEYTKADWKIFRERIPNWQEKYMEKLNKEYAALLSGEGKASEKFWEIEKRVKEDKKKPGVMITLDKSHVVYDLVRLINDGAIGTGDLEGFSEELKEHVKKILECKW